MELDLPVANRLLSQLPASERRRILPRLARETTLRGQILFEQEGPIRHLYFVETGAVSLLALTRRGQNVEVALVGNEGAAGISGILASQLSPYRAMVQTAGVVLKLDIDIAQKEFEDWGMFSRLVLRYLRFLLAEVSQSAVCNRFHSASRRLARWLLTSRDRTGRDTIELTQELLGHMLGTPRPWVTRAVGELQTRGMIDSHRGRITITNPGGLQQASCECYEVVLRHFHELGVPVGTSVSAR